MTITTRAAQQGAPDGAGGPLMPLPPSFLPCRGCGAATRSAVAGHATVLPPDSPAGRPLGVPRVVELGQCPECAARRERAAALASAHRAGPEHRPGPERPGLRVEAVEGVLVALHLLGLPEPESGEADLPLLVRHYRTAAGALFGSVPEPGMASAQPWSHVAPGMLAALRRARAAVLAERVARTAPPVALPPPPIGAAPSAGGERSGSSVLPLPGACLVCGCAAVPLGAVEVERLGGPVPAARAVWRLLTVPAGALGCAAPGLVEGWLCPDCHGCYRDAGAVGPTCIERSLALHLAPGTGTGLAGVPELVGATSWAAIRLRALAAGLPDPEPGPGRWSFVPTALAEGLAAALRARVR